MNEREKLYELIKQAEEEFSKTGKPVLDVEKYVADYLYNKGVIVPLVNVGDTVYIKGEAVEVEFLHIDKEINYFASVDCEAYDCCDCPFYEDDVSWEGEHDCKTYGCLEFTAKDIGRTVFFTREEAEKVLEEHTK